VNSNPIRYRGYYQDAETGYYWLQTRYYNPQWRRFLNADSLFVAGDYLTASNMYAYCDGNPVMKVDPDGMNALEIIWYNFKLVMKAVFSNPKATLKAAADAIALAYPAAVSTLASTAAFAASNG